MIEGGTATYTPQGACGFLNPTAINHGLSNLDATPMAPMAARVKL